jgi:voltage-gated potassium channel
MALPAHYQPFGGRMIQFFLTLQRLVRGIAAAWRRDPQFRSLAVLVAFTLLSGTLFYRAVEGWSLVDAFYFSVTTLTTVGLGDLAPSTAFGKLFTTVYIFAGLGLIAGFVNTVARETLSNRGRGRGGAEGDASEGG